MCVWVCILAALLMRARTIAVIASQLDRMPNFVLLPRSRRGFLQPGHVDVSDGPWKDRIVLANKRAIFHNNVLWISDSSQSLFVFPFPSPGTRAKVKKWKTLSNEFNQRNASITRIPFSAFHFFPSGIKCLRKLFTLCKFLN